MKNLGRSVFLSTLLGLLSVGSAIAESPADELVEAITKDNEKKLSALLHQGADPNSRDPVKQPILSLAAYLGREKMVSLLLANGADLRGTDAMVGTRFIMPRWRGMSRLRNCCWIAGWTSMPARRTD